MTGPRAKPSAGKRRGPAALREAAGKRPDAGAPTRRSDRRPPTRTDGDGPSERKPAVTAAIAAVREALGMQRAVDRVLADFFRTHRGLGPAERGIVAETVYAVLRHKRRLEHVVENGRPDLLALAAIVGYLGRNVREIARDEADAARLEALKAAVRSLDDATLPFAVATDLPDWLAERLAAQYGEAEARALAAALAVPAPLDLRANLVRGTRDEALAQLRAAHLDATPAPLAPLGIRVQGRPSLVGMPVFESGLVEVQDEGSQLVCQLVGARRGEMVVDFCAGAGGKTLALGAAMRSTGRIYAFDVSEKRLDRLKPRLARSGLSNVHPQWIDSERDPRVGRLAGKIDRVLVDAPCSGLGTLRRNPDLKWRQTPADLDELVVKQAAILASAARLVRPGGRLVYATCSILAAENEAIVAAFLAAHPAFETEDAYGILRDQGIALSPGMAPYLRLLPHRDGTDGFFAAALRRRDTREGAEAAPTTEE
jgi:16S rRNA (cytosine967-C5)-methyltransferase